MLSILAVAPKVHAQGTSWLSGWQYRKSHEIVGSAAGAVTDYPIRIVVYYGSGVDSDNKVYLNGKCRTDFGDVRFTADDGKTLLSYWLEDKVDGQWAAFWVKIPSIPAYPDKTVIYIYYGNPNATYAGSPTGIFIAIKDFRVDQNINGFTLSYYSAPTISYSSTDGLIMTPPSGSWAQLRWGTAIDFSTYKKVIARWASTNSQWGARIYITYLYTTSDIYQQSDWIEVYRGYNNGNSIAKKVGGTITGLAGFSSDPTQFMTMIVVFKAGSPAYLKWIADDVVRYEKSETLWSSTTGYVYWYQFSAPGWSSTGRLKFIAVAKHVEPEPSHGVWGIVEVYGAVKLGADAVISRHWLVYSPNSTQFTHSFSATNTTTAGYNTNYNSDAWAWRVYANPYYSSGTAYPNTASLVSNATIALPYSPTNIYKLVLWAKANSTGSRRLWIRVLDSAGNVVAEITNASIGTSWTNVTVPLSINDSKVSIWINATVSSTTSVGEEIAVRGVKLFALRVSTTSSVAELWGSYYNCTTIFSVSLTYSFLNSSTLDLLLRDRLVFNRTTYPGAATYVGSETLNNRIYKVYMISNANVAGNFYVISTLSNTLLNTKVVSRGVEIYRALVGEPISLILPIVANITILEAKARYTNIGNLTLYFSSPGVYTIIVNRTDVVNLSLGYKSLQIVTGYGVFTANLVDTDGKPLDYETLVISVKNLNTGAAKSLTARASATVTGLTYGVHQITVTHRGIPICSGNLDLWIGANGSTVKLSCTLKRLSADYRGVAKSVAWELGKMLLNVTSLNARYPYAKTRYLINGSGLFRLVIDYYSYKPTAVDVKANVSISSVNWDGYYLVITGSLGSVGDIVVSDLYRLRVEAFDRLGNVLPVKALVAVNGTWYTAPVDLLLNPATYIVDVPTAADGFQFYSYGDGYRYTSRAVNISTGDVTLKVFYRVPTRIEVSAYQVMSLWQRLLKFLGLLQDEQYSTIYIDGKALDYYGNGVPNRVVTVKLYTGDGVLLSVFNVTTDASGYYRTPDMKLIRNATYRVEVVYQGDDVYVGSSKTYEFSVAALPVAPAPTAPTPIPTTIMFVIAAAIIVAAIVIGIKIARKTVVEAIENEMSFVKRKRFVLKK